jgi:hypothetical protein
MRRRALLGGITTVFATGLAGCLGDNESTGDGPQSDDGTAGDGSPSNESDEPTDDAADGDSPEDTPETTDTPEFEARCADPPYVLEQGESASFDYATWQVWDAVEDSSAGMSRRVSNSEQTLIWEDGRTITRNGDVFEIQIEQEGLRLVNQDGDSREEYEQGDTVVFRNDSWNVTDIGDGSATLHAAELLTSLKIDWEDGEYLNLDGNIYVVDIDPESRVILCPLSDVND